MAKKLINRKSAHADYQFHSRDQDEHNGMLRANFSHVPDARAHTRKIFARVRTRAYAIKLFCDFCARAFDACVLTYPYIIS